VHFHSIQDLFCRQSPTHNTPCSGELGRRAQYIANLDKPISQYHYIVNLAPLDDVRLDDYSAFLDFAAPPNVIDIPTGDFVEIYAQSDGSEFSMRQLLSSAVVSVRHPSCTTLDRSAAVSPPDVTDGSSAKQRRFQFLLLDARKALR
jgi:hypothetical protein